MAVVQGIQTKQFALEQRTSSCDDSTTRRAQITLAAMAERRAAHDPASALREVLEAVGLADRCVSTSDLVAATS